MDKKINEKTAAIHRASVSKAFNAKPAPDKKKSQMDKDMEDLQSALGKDVVVKPEMKAKGGSVFGSSPKKELNKAGFFDKGRTKSEREKIVSKVTTKPQRLKMVEKMFSAKKMKSGGMASSRADGCAVKGKTKGRMV